MSINLVQVKRMKDACGFYCPDCEIFENDTTWWHWSKSKWMHEQGTGHNTILVTLSKETK